VSDRSLRAIDTETRFFANRVSAKAKSAKAIRCAACNIAQKMAKVLLKKPGFLGLVIEEMARERKLIICIKENNLIGNFKITIPKEYFLTKFLEKKRSRSQSNAVFDGNN
jgi:hypothetical protein